MKICLVTSFPPSQGGLSEYGLHIAQELQRNPFLSLTVLADKIPSLLPDPEGFSVLRCWSFDDPLSTLHLLRALNAIKPDVVWFNLLFSTFGRNPLIAFSGLMTPLLARLTGRYTHVTLHHLMETVDLKDAGVRFARTYRLAGAVATRMLLLSNSVSVLMPGYRQILHEKYGNDNVHVRSHGILTRRPEYPDFSRRGKPVHRILAFGKWGTYKRLELMIEAFELLARSRSDVKLVVGGGDHPQAAGYVESVMNRCGDNPQIEFTGYVSEERLPDLFQSSSVAIMPYSSSTGCSGVAHLACAYGVPIVSSDLVDFRQMADGEELAIEFFQPGNAADLADCLIRFLDNPEKQRAMATQNFSAALRMTMPNVVQKYLRHFELQQRTEALRNITRFRRLPSWLPSRSFFLRAMTRKSLGWGARSPLPRSSWWGGRAQTESLHGDVDGRRKLYGRGVPVNGHGIVTGSGYGGPGGESLRGPFSRAGDANHPGSSQSAKNDDLLRASSAGAPNEGQSGDSDGKSRGVDEFPISYAIHPGNGNGGNRKNRTGAS